MKPFISIMIAAAGLATLRAAGAQTNSLPTAARSRQTAQDKPLAPEDPINRLSQELNLNGQQKSKVQAVFEETREKIQTAVQQAMTNADTQLQQILTRDQYRKLQDLELQHQNSNQRSSQPGATGSKPNDGK